MPTRADGGSPQQLHRRKAVSVGSTLRNREYHLFFIDFISLLCLIKEFLIYNITIMKVRYETNISAKQYQTRPNPRFSETNVDQTRQTGYQPTPGQGQKTPLCITHNREFLGTGKWAPMDPLTIG
jgi:hypothetical protein